MEKIRTLKLGKMLLVLIKKSVVVFFCKLIVS